MKYDEEPLDLGAIMHDLDLTVEVSGTQRFEFYWENTARRFVLMHSASKHRIAPAGDLLASRTSGRIYDLLRAKVAHAGFGVLPGFTGTGIESQPIKHIREVVLAWPRHSFRPAFSQLGAEIVGRKPETAQVGVWNAARLPEDLAVLMDSGKGCADADAK